MHHFQLEQKVWAFAEQLNLHHLPSWHLLQAALSWLNESPHPFHGIHSPAFEAALTTWQEGHNEPPPLGQASHHQNVWDTPKICGSKREVLEASPHPGTCACLLAVATKEAALCVPHQCRHCTAMVDHRSTHGRRTFSKGHAALNYIIKRILDAA